MIPVQSDILDIDEIPGEEIEFSIGDPRWMMRSQARMYSNREMAVAREYSTNAYDANVERFTRRGLAVPPIKVTLPSMMNNLFIVEDAGDGMSLDDLRNVYTKFGNSTKRDTNEANGIFGFGCKSALAYTSTFTVITVHDGTKIEAQVKRRDDWSIVMKIVATSRTTAPSGTKIVVPVHNWQEFTQKANDFYKFWLPGRVLVNGVEPVHSVGEKITDGLYHSKNWNTSYVVIANVPYRIENPQALFRNGKMQPVNFVAYVDNGSMEFTPNREALEYTEHTKAELQKVIDNFADSIVAKAKASITKAKTHAEAYEAWSKWGDVLGSAMFGDLTFKGDKFESSFIINAKRYHTRGGSYSTYSVRDWPVASMKNTMVVTEFGVECSSNAKAKAKKYATQMGWDFPTYILFTAASDPEIKSPWINRDKFVTWEHIKASLPKKPRVAGGGGRTRVKGTFDYYAADRQYREEDIPDDKNLYYIWVKDVKDKNICYWLTLADPDGVVVTLGINRIEKFKRENPKAKEFIAFAQSKVVKDTETLLSDEAKEVMSVGSDTRNWLAHLNLTKIKDKRLHHLADLVKRESLLLERYRNNEALAKQVGMWYNLKQYSPVKHSIYDTYPLLRHLSSYGSVHEHVYLYIDAVNAAKEGK